MNDKPPAMPGDTEGLKLVVGLGNPGPSYARHRHNIGFRCIDSLARDHQAARAKSQDLALIESAYINSCQIVLARPMTFMNNSGEAVARLVHRLRLEPRNVLVIYDEMDLPLGTVRVRARGSHGGHKGMRSIIERLGSQDIPRVRVGVGRPPTDGGPDKDKKVVRWLLSDFSRGEEEAIEDAVQRAKEATLCVIKEGVVTAMNRFN